MINKFRNLPLRIKMTGISLAVNMLVFIINIVLLVAMNQMSDKIDTVYRANLQLNEISSSIKRVQESMTEYLDTKTSDSLEDYYRSSQVFSELTDALGDEITVPGLSEKLICKVPAGTQSGTVLRIKGKGVKDVRTGRPGDMYVKVSIEVPTKLTAAQKEMIKKFGETKTLEGYSRRKSFSDMLKDMFT